MVGKLDKLIENDTLAGAGAILLALAMFVAVFFGVVPEAEASRTLTEAGALLTFGFAALRRGANAKRRPSISVGYSAVLESEGDND